jgi:hypothetical protein
VPRTQAANADEPVVPVTPADGLHGVDFVDVATGRGLTRAELAALMRGGRYPARSRRCSNADVIAWNACACGTSGSRKDMV